MPGWSNISQSGSNNKSVEPYEDKDNLVLNTRPFYADSFLDTVVILDTVISVDGVTE